jgi:Holliday junction resolvase RusA-like endonuclease
MFMKITFTVPLLPPSVNSCWRKKSGGGFYLTPEANAFINAVGMLAPKDIPQERAFYIIDVMFHVQQKDFLRHDLDNYAKLACDSLTKSGVITDDRYIIDLHLHKESVIGRGNEGTTFTVLTK